MKRAVLLLCISYHACKRWTDLSANTYSHQKLNRFLSNTSQLVHLSISPDTEFDRVVSHEKFD